MSVFLVVCGCHSKKEFRDGYITGLAAGYALSINGCIYNPKFLESGVDLSKIDFKEEMKIRFAENKNMGKEAYDDYVKNGRKV